MIFQLKKLEASHTFPLVGWLKLGLSGRPVVEIEMLERLWYDGEGGFQNKNQELLISWPWSQEDPPPSPQPWGPGAVDHSGAVLFVGGEGGGCCCWNACLDCSEADGPAFLKGQGEDTGKNKQMWKPKDA